jgi:hypothetical protein
VVDVVAVAETIEMAVTILELASWRSPPPFSVPFILK